MHLSRRVDSLPLWPERQYVILLLKPGKDPVDPGSYRSILLLQNDVKILAKVLTLWVNGIVSSIILPDQAGFMPQKSTATNLRRLFLDMQLQEDNGGHRALLSLYANKAFNSIKWRYLCAVLSKFGFGDRFIAWVKWLYASRRQQLGWRTGCQLLFAMGRGTRQGCPLSALLFAIAIEPLAALVRARTQVRGFQHGAMNEKIMLYADDMMLFLGDSNHSLTGVMSILSEFAHYSGLTINWSKSPLMMLDEER